MITKSDSVSGVFGLNFMLMNRDQRRETSFYSRDDFTYMTAVSTGDSNGQKPNAINSNYMQVRKGLE